MSLKTTTMKSAPKDRVAQKDLEVGNYMCRVAQIIDMGVQVRERWDEATRSFVTDQDKQPRPMVRVTYEFLTEFYVDKDGKPDEEAPRLMGEKIYLMPFDSDLATSTKRSKSLDPTDSLEGDWSLYGGLPCQVTIAQTKKGKAKIGTVTPPIKGVPYPELKKEPLVFLLDNPDMEAWERMPDFIKDDIGKSLNFTETKLYAILNGEEPKKSEAPAQPTKEVPPSAPDLGDDEDGEDDPW